MFSHLPVCPTFSSCSSSSPPLAAPYPWPAARPAVRCGACISGHAGSEGLMPYRPEVFRSASQDAMRAKNRAAYDARRLAESETRKLYRTVRWYRQRSRQLRDHPICRLCEAEGRIAAAVICDHVTPHRGDVERFWAGPFQSLCKPCHDSAKQREESSFRFVRNI